MTIRRRLTLYYSATLVGTVTIAILLMILALIDAVGGAVQETARATALEVARELDAGAEPDATLLRTVGDGNVLVVVRDAGGGVLAETDHPVVGIGADERAAAPDVWREALATGEPAVAGAVEAYVYALPVSPAASSARVVEAWASYDKRGEATLPVGTSIVYVFTALVLLGLIGGFVVVRGALRPVETLAESAEGITASDLSRRLPDRGTRDELDRVATSFNGVLTRLESSFAEREAVLTRQRRFTSDASHELRTPLASILGYARMLRTWGLSDPTTAAEGVAMIEREATRLVAMTEHLLDLARGDESGAPVRRESCDLRELAACEVETVRAASPAGPSFTLDPPGRLVTADVDPTDIRRALGAILENAARFTPRDGAVRVVVTSADGWATISIADTGPGIPAEHLAHVFDRFYQADPSRAASGSGLGLALARQVAERHGGRIDVASEPGHGATFTLRLPTCPSSSHPTPSSRSRSHPSVMPEP